MNIPLYYLLFPYGFFILVWLVLSGVALYHMLKFGFKNYITLAAVFIYLSVSASLISVSFLYISAIDWQSPIGGFSSAGLYELPELR